MKEFLLGAWVALVFSAVAFVFAPTTVVIRVTPSAIAPVGSAP